MAIYSSVELAELAGRVAGNLNARLLAWAVSVENGEAFLLVDVDEASGEAAAYSVALDSDWSAPAPVWIAGARD